MRITISALLFLYLFSLANGQNPHLDWYSESENNGVILQNSFNKGGPYTGPVKKYFNISNLVYFTRVHNASERSLELTIHFSTDSIPIPNAPDTFVKLYIPPDTMTLDKRSEFNFGVRDLQSFDHPTRFHRKLKPGEDCLFNVVAIFIQTKADAMKQDRGGNRGEFVLKGEDLYYRMLPQIDNLYCGRIVFSQ